MKKEKKSKEVYRASTDAILNGKRKTTGIPDALRTKILERDVICVYCGEEPDSVDHIVPYSWSKDNSEYNLVACCMRCNNLAYNFMFDTFEDKRMYILDKIKHRTRKHDFYTIAHCAECGNVFRQSTGKTTLFLCEDCAKDANNNIHYYKTIKEEPALYTVFDHSKITARVQRLASLKFTCKNKFRC